MTRMVMVVLLMLGIGVAVAAAQTGGARKTTTAAQATASAPVNLNTASVAQLEALPGIGKATADRIVEYRQKNGSIHEPLASLGESRFDDQNR